MNTKNIIDDTWLKKQVTSEITGYQFYVALTAIFIIGALSIFLFHGTSPDSSLIMGLEYATIGTVIFGIALTITFRLSERFHTSVLNSRYQSEKARLEYFLEFKKRIKESFRCFVTGMIESAALKRPETWEDLKRQQIEVMEKYHAEIEELRIRFKSQLHEEGADTVQAMKTLGKPDDLDEENLEFLLENLGLLIREKDNWDLGGKNAYRERITPAYVKTYEPQLQKRLVWPEETIILIRERLQGMKKLAEEKGLLLD